MANTVRIGCKLPNGLILEILEAGPGMFPAPMGKRVFLKGSNSTLTAKGENPLIARFAFTDVDADFWEAWMKKNKDMPFVKNGSVFMEESAKDAKAAAKERKDVPTGLEPLEPKGDKRIPAGATADPDRLKLLGVA
jgi:hypothetical protein